MFLFLRRVSLSYPYRGGNKRNFTDKPYPQGTTFFMIYRESVTQENLGANVFKIDVNGLQVYYYHQTPIVYSIAGKRFASGGRYPREVLEAIDGLQCQRILNYTLFRQTLGKFLERYASLK